MMYKYISILFIFILFMSCEENNKMEENLESMTIEYEIQKLNLRVRPNRKKSNLKRPKASRLLMRKSLHI